jgi:hypothetical protein
MASRVVSSERTRVPREGCRRTTKTTYDETRASCKARDQLADPAKCASVMRRRLRRRADCMHQMCAS